MPENFHLISSVTCPWVQRSVIAMRAKDVSFDVTYVDLQNKPDWFLALSPHGKVPVLKVDDTALFESNAIAEYLDETFEPKLTPLTRLNAHKIGHGRTSSQRLVGGLELTT